MELIQGEELIWSGKPSWRSTMSLYLTWAAIGLIPLVVILFVRWVSDTDWSIGIGLGVVVLVVGIAVLVGWLRRYFTQYTITNRRITIRTGVLSKTEQTAHLDRLQNVTINQTLFDRVFRVGMIDFDTAGSDTEANLRFYGINEPQELRNRIAAEYLDGHDATKGGV